MRKQMLFTAALLLFAIPLFAEEKHQSYISYDTGGALVVQQNEGGEITARMNLPIYPGDELRTTRVGRTEVMLADGNIVALSRDTAVRFLSMADSYEGDDSGTVAELRYGQIIAQRLDSSDSAVRLDTDVASYVATRDAIYSVETNHRGRDIVTVLDGSVEVRTPNRVVRLNGGERASVDQDGIYGVLTVSSYSLGDFEEWYLHRAERYGRSSRYLDTRLSYADDDLASYGSWVSVSGYGRAWRPRVSLGWRPYYYGSWQYSPSGCLVWVSDEPWGWVPYHYGRWSFTPMYGWVWLPGGRYAPAWVYWAFGPSWVGWSPAGWYDCYRPYYSWMYQPYVHVGINVGFGFYGRVNFHSVDLQPWTFTSPGVLVSNRVDKTALTTDAIRDRLRREGDRVAVTKGVFRLDRNGLKDPSTAVRQIARGIGGGTGTESSGATVDMTPFFRRDPELSPAVRDRVSRLGRPEGDTTAAGRRIARELPTPSVNPTAPAGVDGRTVRRTPGSDGTLNRGDWRGTDRSGDRGTTPSRDSGRSIGRDTTTPREVSRPAPRADSGAATRNRDGNDSWRGRAVERPQAAARQNSDVERPAARPQREPVDRPSPSQGEDQQWRHNAVRRDAPEADRNDDADNRDRSSSSASDWRRRPSSDDGADVPRRVIDSIGGARVTPSDRGRDRFEPRRETQGERPSVRERPSAPERSSGSNPRAERAPESRPQQSSPPQRDHGGSRERAQRPHGEEK